MAVTIFQNYMMKVEKELGVFNLVGEKKGFSVIGMITLGRKNPLTLDDPSNTENLEFYYEE